MVTGQERFKDAIDHVQRHKKMMDAGFNWSGEDGYEPRSMMRWRRRRLVAIVEAVQEHPSGLQQINTAVNQMDQDTQKNAAMVEETTAASHGLAQEVASLNQLLAVQAIDT
jgi:methyl-accepting chemotaxis protein